MTAGMTQVQIQAYARQRQRARLATAQQRGGVGVHPASETMLAFTTHTKPDYQVNWHHETLCRCLDQLVSGDSRRLMVFMPPRHGKCLAQGSEVLLFDGRLVPIEQIIRRDMVISLDPWYNTTTECVIATQNNGIKPVRRITLQSGRFIECTDNHPLLTVGGWADAGTLHEGDSIAAMRQTPLPNGDPLPFGFAALMGYITGDGSFGQGNPIITASEPETVAHLEEIGAAHGWVLTRDGKYGYHVRNATGRGKHDGTSAQERLRAYMTPAKSAQKRVPECIFKAGRADLVAFIAAYFNCDGTVNDKREGAAELYSTSEFLLRDVQTLLTRLGIYSTLRIKRGRYKGAVHLSWRLIISGGDLVSFADQVPARGVRGAKLREVAETSRSKAHYPEYDAIPSGWKAYLKKGLGWHRNHTKVRADKEYKRGAARHIVLALAESEDNDDLRRLCSPNVSWERIVKVEDIGELPTYDIEVGGGRNFISGGVVVHNSELVSRRLPAYILGHDPDAALIACSYSATLASRMNRDVQRIIDDPRYHEVFPETNLYSTNVRTVAQGTYLRNSDVFEVVGKRGIYQSAGIGGGISGMGFSFGIIDDPIKNQKEADSATFRESIWEWYTSTFWTRQAPDSRILLTLTRWHEDDLAGRLLQLADTDPRADQWEVLCLPAICEDPYAPYERRQEGAALWPERYGLDFFAAAQANNPRQHTAINQQSPRAREGNMFKLKDLPIVPVAPQKGRRVRYWDLGGSDSNTADYSAGVLMNAAVDRLFYIEDVQRGQWSPNERNERIKLTAEQDRATYGHVDTWIERVPGLAVEVVDTIVRFLAGYPVRTEMARQDKTTRADPLASQCEAGNVRVVQGAWNAAYRDEMASFPNGKNDDQVDGSSGAFSKVAQMSTAKTHTPAPTANRWKEM